ncbi:type II toxin-antitoxin system VapC family toxin [Klenkia sp. LSe6-5]|uniref:Type II toxin-antitoxin system VapC family toxin n=1 Tax=Klenkia sesuvii TaxID=3103137 RepID=A0ABU8DUT7_9ACTN
MVSASYVDTSVAVHVLLGNASARAWFDDATGGAEPVISSRLLRTELTRVLRREGVPVSRRDAVLDHLSVVPLDHAVLQEAEAIVPHVRTLDAIHLASALRTGIDDLVVVTHDATLRSVAEELGLRTLDPVR